MNTRVHNPLKAMLSSSIRLPPSILLPGAASTPLQCRKRTCRAWALYMLNLSWLNKVVNLGLLLRNIS